MSVRAGKKAKFRLYTVAAKAFSGSLDEICPKDGEKLKIKKFPPI